VFDTLELVLTGKDLPVRQLSLEVRQRLLPVKGVADSGGGGSGGQGYRLPLKTVE